jgi:hypothetical protein
MQEEARKMAGMKFDGPFWNGFNCDWCNRNIFNKEMWILKGSQHGVCTHCKEAEE